VYQGRRETQAELHEANWQKVEAMRSGTYQPELDEPDLDDEGGPESAAFQVMQFPTAVAPPERPARDRVLAAVAQGVTRTAEIQKEVGLSKSQCAAVLKDLLESKELERPTAGVYAIAGSATPPER
jgi:bacterioferritin-associated ferredoxin